MSKKKVVKPVTNLSELALLFLDQERNKDVFNAIEGNLPGIVEECHVRGLRMIALFGLAESDMEDGKKLVLMQVLANDEIAGDVEDIFADAFAEALVRLGLVDEAYKKMVEDTEDEDVDLGEKYEGVLDALEAIKDVNVPEDIRQYVAGLPA